MNRLWELALKIFFHSPEMNRPVFFSNACVVNDEEETLLSSIPHTRRKNISLPGSMSIQFLLPMETILGEEPASSLLCGFAFAFDRHENKILWIQF